MNNLYECKSVNDVKSVLESGLSRIYKHISNHESGSITAYRGNYSNADNKKRNQILRARLLKKGYDLTVIDGIYVEDFGTADAKKVKEKVFFVVDSKDKGNLKKDLIELGQDPLDVDDNQDSVLFIPKGGNKSILIGTSKKPDAFLGFKKELPFSKRSLGDEGEFFSKVSG